MSFEGKLIALLDSMTQTQIQGMRRVDREQLANQLQRVYRLTELADVAVPKSGVLAHLHNGARAE